VEPAVSGPDRPVDIGDRIAAVMGIDPAAAAVHHGDTGWTWGELARHGEALTTALPLPLRDRPGLRVAVVMRNRPPHVAAILGTVVAHRCLVPVSSLQKPARLADDVAALRAPVVVADTEDWAHAELAGAVRQAGSVGLALDGHDVRVVVEPEAAGPEVGEDRHSDDSTAILMPTSGTTGPPKRVPISYHDLAIGFDRVRRYARSNASAAGGLTLSAGVAVSVTPLVHIAGLWGVLQFAVEGRQLALLDRFEPHAWADLVARYRPKVTMLPPAALVMLLDADVDPAKLESLRAIMCGTAPLAPEVEERFSTRFGLPVLTTYGATEFPGGLVGWTLTDKLEIGAAKRGSTGRARPGVEIRVVDPDSGDPLPPDSEGAIEARTPQTVARGVDGWVRTTDLGRLDGDGFLWVTGRADGAINRGGFKIMPEQVEEVLAAHPAVRAAGVVGLPDPRLGQVPAAAVEACAPVSTDELAAWARERLLAYQVPARIELVDELPRTPSMKVSRPGVIELLEDAAG
jgi:acyl-CoA synthetase (AMP-forming)/AMP-acid ligase II